MLWRLGVLIAKKNEKNEKKVLTRMWWHDIISKLSVRDSEKHSSFKGI